MFDFKKDFMECFGFFLVQSAFVEQNIINQKSLVFWFDLTNRLICGFSVNVQTAASVWPTMSASSLVGRWLVGMLIQPLSSGGGYWVF